MPRGPESWGSAPKRAGRTGLIVPGVSVDGAIDPKLLRFFRYLADEFLDADPTKMTVLELHAKSYFPLKVHLSLGLEDAQGTPDVTKVPGWSDLGLALRWIPTETSSSFSLGLYIADPTRPVAKQLVRAINGISARLIGLKAMRKKRRAILEKINSHIHGYTEELRELGVAFVYLPDIVGEEEMEPDAAIPNGFADDRKPPTFRPTRAIRKVYNVRDHPPHSK